MHLNITAPHGNGSACKRSRHYINVIQKQNHHQAAASLQIQTASQDSFFLRWSSVSLSRHIFQRISEVDTEGPLQSPDEEADSVSDHKDGVDIVDCSRTSERLSSSSSACCSRCVWQHGNMATSKIVRIGTSMLMNDIRNI